MQELKFSNPITGSEVSVYDGADSKYLLFEGYSICKLLGYANPARTIEQLVSSKYIRRVRGILGRNKLPKVLLTEPGVYQLAIRSRAKRAEQFQSWVFEEVLPSIHHNGGYIMGQEKLSEDERNNLLSRIHNLEQEVSNARKALGMTGESKKRDAKKYRTLSMQLKAKADELDEEGDNILANMNEMPNETKVFE